MVQVWHPDRFPHNPDLQRKAQERAKQINNAYDILKRYLKDGEIPRPRPRPSAQSQKQETEQRTRQQETAAEDAQSSQTHEEENRQKQTTKPFEEESLAAKIGILLAGVLLILASFIVTFFGRIIDTIRAKRQNRPFIGIHEGWFAYTTIGVCGGTIGGIVCGLPVSIIGNEAITSIAAFIGAAVGARLAYRHAVRKHLKRKK